MLDETSQQLSGLYALSSCLEGALCCITFHDRQHPTAGTVLVWQPKTIHGLPPRPQRQRKITDSETGSNLSRIMDANEFCCATFDAAIAERL